MKKSAHFTKQARRASMTVEEKKARRHELRVQNGQARKKLVFTSASLPSLRELVSKGAL